MDSSNSIYTGFKFEENGHPALAVINSNLKHLKERYAYKYAVFIQIIPDTFNAMGHPEAEEYDYLSNIEKEIIEYLETQTESLHVGHTTLYRKREIIFYTKATEQVKSFLNYYLPTVERENTFDIKLDEEWENVSGFYEQL
jgi:hypothetical protein